MWPVRDVRAFLSGRTLRAFAYTAALLCAVPAWCAPSVPKQPAGSLTLFGVEIGGEDGFSLTDRSAYESAKREGARSIDLRPVWSVLEPQPGVYDWSTLDAALEHAASVELPVTISVRFFDFQVPAWLAEENMLDQDGQPFSGYGYKGVHLSPSYWGPHARSSYLKLVDALVRRYRTNNNILAWQFFYGYNDSFYMGMWNGRQTVYDYSTFSQVKYRDYLQHTKKLSLRALNQRYGTAYSRWEEVAQPKPTFDELNASRVWHDFQDYRMWSIERMFDEIDRTVRRLDARPLIMYYGGSFHHASYQLSVYDIGLRLLRKYKGMLDVTCYEDPVPAEIGTGIIRSYGVTPMCEAWQCPPPLKDFRRLFFHAFSLGAKSYQVVGPWEKLEPTPDEFQRTAHVFQTMADTHPVRARVAGLVSYRTVMSMIPAKPYINPTLALIPKLQEHQYSLDWHSDMSPLDDLKKYPALLDANSEVLGQRTIDRLTRYVERGGRLALLCRSGKYVVETGRSDYPLLARLQGPALDNAKTTEWSFGKGRVLRVGQEVDWSTPEGEKTLLQLMDWLHVQRPITATAGTLAALARNARGEVFVILFWPKAEPGEASFAIRPEALGQARAWQSNNLFAPDAPAVRIDSETLSAGLHVSFAPYELKVLKLSPE